MQIRRFFRCNTLRLLVQSDAHESVRSIAPAATSAVLAASPRAPPGDPPQSPLAVENRNDDDDDPAPVPPAVLAFSNNMQVSGGAC